MCIRDSSKCRLMGTEVTFLGHVVSSGGIAVAEAKVSAVSNWPRPKTARDIKSFLGLAGYYRRYVREFAHVVSPLQELATQENKKRVAWDDACEEAFTTLKSALTTAPILAYPEATGKFFVSTDASDLALGAVLEQEQSIDGQLERRVIAYWPADSPLSLIHI